jgi:hypothetical protein
MPDNEHKSKFDRLKDAVDWSIRQLDTPRRKRVEAVRQFVGSHYADDGSEKVVPVNLIELAVTIYIRQLAARAPRVMVSTKIPSLKIAAGEMELAINQLPDELGLGDTFRRAVLEAMFCIGVVKCGICWNGKTYLGRRYGEPYAEIVSIDDYFVDMSAKSYDTIQFEGNDYWISLEDARNNPSFAGAEKLEADEHTVTGDDGGGRAEGVTQDEGGEVYRDKVWLRDVWLPAENKLLTYAVKTGVKLAEVDWDGPEGGPYHRLSFSDVPGNVLPLPPVSLWRDLHDLENRLFRKLGKQADNQKTVLGFSSGDDEDIQRFKDARDGDGIRYTGSKPEQLTAGGVDQLTLAFFLQTRDLFSYMAGNLDALGGLAPMTETVGQDQMLSNAASARIRDMSDAAVKFYRSVFKSLAWYEWTDPVRVRTIEKRLKGTEFFVKTRWSEETREGDFLDYNFDIDVYSMQDDSPSTRLQRIEMIFERFILPLAPMILEQGGTIDAQALLDLLAKYSDTEELKELVKFAQGMPEQEEQPRGGSPQPARMPAHTTRTYERVNRPGATRQGKDQVLTQLLLGNAQKSEAATLFRGVS